MRKILCVLLAMVMCLSILPVVAATTAPMNIIVDQTTVEYGATEAIVNISIPNNPGIAVVAFDVNYDNTAMTLETATLGSIFTGDLECNLNRVPFTFNVYTGAGNKENSGTLVTLKFKLNQNCEAKIYDITLENAEALNIDEESVDVAVTNGAIKVEKEEVTGVTLNKTATTLTVGTAETLTATVLPSDATNKNVTWSSSDNNVATVDNGVVTAVGEGTAIITVETVVGNKKATCAVTVNAPIDENLPNVKIVGAKGKSGKTVDVVIEIVNNPGIAYLSLDLGYDSSVMTLQSVTGNDVFDVADFVEGDLQKNPYTVLAVNYKNNKTTNGKFVTATFLINEDCAEGDYEITITNPESYNIDEVEKTFTVTNGIVTVKNIDAGDVTGDGKINGMDLLRLGKYFAGWTVDIDETGADVTGDGKINGMDLLRLGKYFAGWEVKLGK